MTDGELTDYVIKREQISEKIMPSFNLMYLSASICGA
jgi:hypothetical protein